MPKKPIKDNDQALKFLHAAKCQRDQVITFLMLAFGMHNKNVRELVPKNITIGQVSGLLEFRRVKNQRYRSENLSLHQAQIILKWVKSRKLNKTNRTYENICEYMGQVLDDYPGKVSPMTLRHTFVFNMLKKYWMDPDKMDLVAFKAGCHRNTVMRNYIDFDDWASLHDEDEIKPLDLSKFVFME